MVRSSTWELLNFRRSRGRLGRFGFLGFVGIADALDTFLKSLDSLTQTLAEPRKLARSEDQKRYDQNYYQMPGL